MSALTITDLEADVAAVGSSAWATWTPTLASAGGTAPTYTSTFQNRYCKIGKTVFCSLIWYNSSGGVAGGGGNPITFTLPLPVSSLDAGGGGMAFIDNVGGADSYITGMVGPEAGTSFAYFFISAGRTLIANGQNQANREIRASFSYEVA